jgi:hypothetical protein
VSPFACVAALLLTVSLNNNRHKHTASGSIRRKSLVWQLSPLQNEMTRGVVRAAGHSSQILGSARAAAAVDDDAQPSKGLLKGSFGAALNASLAVGGK